LFVLLQNQLSNLLFFFPFSFKFVYWPFLTILGRQSLRNLFNLCDFSSLLWFDSLETLFRDTFPDGIIQMYTDDTVINYSASSLVEISGRDSVVWCAIIYVWCREATLSPALRYIIFFVYSTTNERDYWRNRLLSASRLLRYKFH
jgi:hypothetical protein